MEKELRILMLEDVASDAEIIERELRKRGIVFSARRVETEEAFLKELEDFAPDIILADYKLPSFDGITALAIKQKQYPDVPFILVSGAMGEEFAIETLKMGATDYVLKHNLSRLVPSVIRALREVEDRAERKRMEEELRALSLADELTGLYNRRGFLTLAQQQVEIANRTKRGMSLIFADIDDIKWINDTFGHHEGDIALVEIANILKKTFRKSDIVARIGGDEFVVLMVEDAGDNAEIMATRLEDNLDAYNATGTSGYRLSLSVGIAYYDPERPCSIYELLDRADKLMYERKQGKKNKEL